MAKNENAAGTTSTEIPSMIPSREGEGRPLTGGTSLRASGDLGDSSSATDKVTPGGMGSPFGPKVVDPKAKAVDMETYLNAPKDGVGPLKQFKAVKEEPALNPSDQNQEYTTALTAAKKATATTVAADVTVEKITVANYKTKRLDVVKAMLEAAKAEAIKEGREYLEPKNSRILELEQELIARNFEYDLLEVAVLNTPHAKAGHGFLTKLTKGAKVVLPLDVIYDLLLEGARLVLVPNDKEHESFGKELAIDFSKLPAREITTVAKLEEAAKAANPAVEKTAALAGAAKLIESKGGLKDIIKDKADLSNSEKVEQLINLKNDIINMTPYFEEIKERYANTKTPLTEEEYSKGGTSLFGKANAVIDEISKEILKLL